MEVIMKKLLVLAMVLLFTGIIFISCGKIGDNKIHLRFMFWGDIEEINIINNTIARFEKAYPNIKVHAERAPSGNPYLEKVLTQIAGNSAPDVIFVSSDDIITFAKKGLLMDLNPYIQKDKFPINQFYQGLVNRFKYQGKLYVIPRDIAPVACLYYNKKLFDQAGVKYPKDNWTWNDMLAAAKKLTKVDKTTGQVIHFGLCDDWNLWDGFVLNNGGSYADNIENPTKLTLDSPQAIQAIQFRRDLVYKYKVMPSAAQLATMGGVGTSDMFMSGKAAMFLSGIWKTPMFRKIVDFDWDIAMFPKGPMAKKPGFPGGGSGYGVIKTTKHPEEAWKLVTYLAGEEGQKELALTGLAQPAIIEMAKKYFVDDKKPKNKKMLLEACNYIIYTPFTEKWPEIIQSEIGPEMDQIWLNKNKEDIGTIMKRIMKKVNQKYFGK